MSEGGFIPSTIVGTQLALRITKGDSVPAVRNLINKAMTSLSTAVMRQWLAMPGEYDIDIEITMTKKGA